MGQTLMNVTAQIWCLDHRYIKRIRFGRAMAP
jgi:hypothetical protein